MKLNATNARDFMQSLRDALNKEVADSWTLERVQEKEVEDFLKYKELAKTYQEFSDLTIGICEQMDEQSNMLRGLQNDMLKLLSRKEDRKA